jgi:hypothetical protein
MGEPTMSFHSWLRSLRSALAPRRGQRHRGRRGALRAATHRLNVEALEDRRVPAFLAPVDYAVGVSPNAVKAGDFNGDGIQDLATANVSSGSVSVLLGNPDGTFQPARSSYAGDGLISSFAVGDFNEDGKLDLATGGNYYAGYGGFGVDDVVVLLGNGDGTFRPPVHLGTNLAAESVVTGDLNGDENLDLVVTSRDDSQRQLVSVLLGGGDGTFAPATTYDPTGYLPEPALADFNGDGKLDLAGGRQVFLGNRDGTFREPSDIGPDAYYWTTVGDFDRDGKLDLAGISFGRVGVLRGNGDGTFQPAQSFPAGSSPHALSAADVNDDGVLDLVMAGVSWPDGYVTALLGNGGGSFGPPITTATEYYPTALVVADFNADGRPDAAGANNWSDTVAVWLNDGVWPPDDPPSVSIHDVGVYEGNAGTVDATFMVTLSHNTNVDVTVHFATADITATAGSDYTATSGTVIISAGQISATVTVVVRGERLPEPEETFAVNLTDATGATISDGQAIGTIFDNEPRISITDFTKAEGRKPFTTVFTFTVTLGVAYDQPVTVSFRTVNGTATTSNNDYEGKTGTLTFAPGETTKTIWVYVKGDNKREANEYFYVDLFNNSSNSWFTRSRGVGTILNDD